MTQITDGLKHRFLSYHQRTTRQIRNRDKALIRDRDGNCKDRFYLTPTQSHIEAKHVIPDEGTSWQFVLYNTAILTVQPDDVGVIDLGGWYSAISFDHLQVCLRHCDLQRWIQQFKANKRTPSVYVLTGDECKTKLFSKLEIDLNTGQPINPKPLTRIVVPNIPEVKEIRRNLMQVRKKYIDLARLHEAGGNPELPKLKSLTYQELINETEVNAQTYSSLISQNTRKRWWSKRSTPVENMDAVLLSLREAEYRKYYVEEEI